MNVFSMDESGYTGYDLLQKSQPMQGASSININHDDAEYLIKQHFPKLKSAELKFGAMKRRDSYKKPLYQLQKELLANFPCITCVADKRFLLMLMFVDYAVEPFYYDKGENLYENGGNHSLASLAMLAGPAYFGQGFEVILRAFQVAMHEKTLASVTALINAVQDVNWFKLPELLGPLATESPDCIDAILNSETTTDASLSILIALVTRTELISSGPYCIEHDRSDNLLSYSQHLKFLMGLSKKAEFKQSDIATIRFPLKLKEVYQVDSKLSPSVQLCDVLIGGAIRGAIELREDIEPTFYNPIQLYRDDQIIHFLPDNDFAGQQEFRKGSQGAELIDFIQQEFFDKRLQR